MSQEDLVKWAQDLPNLKVYRNMASILEAKNPKTGKARVWLLDSEANLNQIKKELEELNG